jgi:hypothetical protein
LFTFVSREALADLWPERTKPAADLVTTIVGIAAVVAGSGAASATETAVTDQF